MDSGKNHAAWAVEGDQLRSELLSAQAELESALKASQEAGARANVLQEQLEALDAQSKVRLTCSPIRIQKDGSGSCMMARQGNLEIVMYMRYACLERTIRRHPSLKSGNKLHCAACLL